MLIESMWGKWIHEAFQAFKGMECGKYGAFLAPPFSHPVCRSVALFNVQILFVSFSWKKIIQKEIRTKYYS